MVKSSKPKTGELVFGIHAIVELLKAKKRSITVIYTTKPQPKSWEEIEKLLPKYTQIQYVSRDVLHRLADTTDHQGVVAWATPYGYRSTFFSAQKEKFVVLLDGIQDPRNLGAIIRSAYCIGVDGIIITQKNSSPLNATALKASAGLAEHMPIYRASSAKAALVELEREKYHVYVSQLNPKAQSATEVDYSMPACLVIGSEGAGVSRELVNAGTSVMLPQKSADISYNASVAAGVLMFLMAMGCKRI